MGGGAAAPLRAERSVLKVNHSRDPDPDAAVARRLPRAVIARPWLAAPRARRSGRQPRAPRAAGTRVGVGLALVLAVRDPPRSGLLRQGARARARGPRRVPLRRLAVRFGAILRPGRSAA
jgi:hypothetical protein